MNHNNHHPLKKLLAKLRRWPLHPQWFAYRQEVTYYRSLSSQLQGRVLDIGCTNQFLKTYLPQVDYLGLDYYQTAVHWYTTRPQIYGDAQQLPFPDNSLDAVLLLDVLEHLPRPEDCWKEIARVLKPGGLFILKVPFLYPIHDAPLDFQRWTQYGLRHLAQKYGFVIRQATPVGRPLETAALLMNIAISKTILNWLGQKHPLVFLSVVAPVLILGINLLGWLFSRFSPEEEMMPHSYRLVLSKVK